jgi:hypothetical protein
VLAVVVLLSVLATAAGARQGSGPAGPSGSGLPETLGRVLVLPLKAVVLPLAGGCPAGKELTVPAGRECAFGLRSGFLAKRLRLRLAAGDSLTAVVVQPRPKVTDTETLDAARPSADLVYRQDGSTLTLTCGADQKGCAARVDSRRQLCRTWRERDDIVAGCDARTAMTSH